jgi:hypothetical protein
VVFHRWIQTVEANKESFVVVSIVSSALRAIALTSLEIWG